MIPRLKPPLGFAELGAVFPLPRRGDVEGFEQAFATEMGQRHGIAFPYGRTALMFLFEALGLRDREIICPAYTCVVVAHAIVHSGNTPVFVDSREDDFLMDLDLAETAITGRTGSIVATSLFGQPVDLDRLAELQHRHPEVAVIQDCAHSFAASYKDRPVQVAGRAAIYGLNVSKMITSIFGGMVTTDDDDLARNIRRMRDERLEPGRVTKSLRRTLYLLATYPAFTRSIYGLVNRLERWGLLDGFVKYYDESLITMPEDHLEAMTPVEARVGCTQLRKYQRVVEHRRSAAVQYREALSDVEGLKLPPATPGATFSHYVVKSDQAAFYLREGLRRGVQLGTLIEYVVPDMQAYRKCRFYDRGVARRFVGRVLNLPVHYGVDQRAIERVIEVLQQPPPPRRTETNLPHLADLRCPTCHGPLDDVGHETLSCPDHGRFPVIDGIPSFAPAGYAAFEKHWRDHQHIELPPSKLEAAREFLAALPSDASSADGTLRVLDVGCGDGVHLTVLRERWSGHVEASGVDISLPALFAARSRGQLGWRAIQGDAGSLPFGDGSFDAAFSFGALAYTDDPRQSFAEVCRVVREGGVVGVWFCPKRGGPLGWAFSTTRAVCRFLGGFATARIADLLVPLLPMLPTRSKITLANATWRQCREVVMVNIAPPMLYFPRQEDVEAMFSDERIEIVHCDDAHPIALWGRKRAASASRGLAA